MLSNDHLEDIPQQLQESLTEYDSEDNKTQSMHISKFKLWLDTILQKSYSIPLAKKIILEAIANLEKIHRNMLKTLDGRVQECVIGSTDTLTDTEQKSREPVASTDSKKDLTKLGIGVNNIDCQSNPGRCVSPKTNAWEVQTVLFNRIDLLGKMERAVRGTYEDDEEVEMFASTSPNSPTKESVSSHTSIYTDWGRVIIGPDKDDDKEEKDTTASPDFLTEETMSSYRSSYPHLFCSCSQEARTQAPATESKAEQQLGEQKQARVAS